MPCENARAVILDGVRHNSVKEAAVALGVKPAAIYARMRRQPAVCHYDPAHQPARTRQYGPLSAETRARIAIARRKRVRIHGVTYDSVQAAAAALGVPASTLGWRVLQGQDGYAPA